VHALAASGEANVVAFIFLLFLFFRPGVARRGPAGGARAALWEPGGARGAPSGVPWRRGGRGPSPWGPLTVGAGLGCAEVRCCKAHKKNLRLRRVFFLNSSFVLFRGGPRRGVAGCPGPITAGPAGVLFVQE